MVTYWLVWLCVLMFSAVAQSSDYAFLDKPLNEQVEHTQAAKFWLFLSAVVLIFVAGCRYYIGSDYYAYYGWYQSYAASFWENLRSFDEPGIRFIYMLVTKFVDDGFACVFVTNGIMIALVLRTLYKNTSQTCLATILYSLICWTATFNGMRQALAVAVFFCGVSYLREKKFVKYLIVCVVAFLCHRSAVVMIFLYFVVNRKVNVKNIVLLAVLGITILLSFDRVIEVTGFILDESIEADSTYWANAVNYLRTAANIAPSVFFLYVYRNEEKGEAESFYLNLLLIHAIVALATSNSACLARMSMYTAPFEVLAICELSKVFKKKNRGIIILIVILFWIFESYEVYISPDLTPFKWIWQR